MIFFFSFGPNGPNLGLSSLLFLLPLLLQTGLGSLVINVLRTVFSLSFWWRLVKQCFFSPQIDPQSQFQQHFFGSQINQQLHPRQSLFSLPNFIGFVTAIALGIYVGLNLARHVEWNRAWDRFSSYIITQIEQLIAPFQNHFQFNGGVGRNRVPSRPERVQRVQKILSHLPIEDYKSKQDLMKMSVHQLKEYMKGLGMKCHGLLEKGELVASIIEKGGSTWSTCSICFDDYQSGDALRRLPCQHTYHIECIDKWLLSSTDLSRPPACPFCNTEISKES
eukprot:TRINITY_DN39321_c0_g1_i10.p1 TRINITY_DN39321_c0_g1~~TRINITY_DN39321_c0_g1_i10.p1  ORF type:complete len:278 (-),score=7.33 TRINITY_DN39321_c0_g1_i10:677-1510(-)